MILILSLVLIFFYLLLFGMYARGWRKVPPPEREQAEKPFVSVLIAARNEKANIPLLIQSLDRQEYSRHAWEIIIVDDHSTDGSYELLVSHGLPNMKVFRAGDDIYGKKQAMAMAMEHASGELVITTDADCLHQPGWIGKMASFYSANHAAFIAAPVSFSPHSTLLDKFQALDFMMLQGITAAGMELRLHDMCNGANLAFRREAFRAVNGYEGIDHIATGDDMLLMHKIRKQFPRSVFYLKDEEAIVTTPPMPDLGSFLMQRRRWASKTMVYEDKKIIFILAFVFAVNLWWLVLLIAACINPAHWLTAIAFLLAKAAAELFFLFPVAKFYNNIYLLKYLFFFQPLHIFYTVFVAGWSQLGRYEWKGRRTR